MSTENTITGTEGNDTLDGTDANDHIQGLGGNDNIGTDENNPSTGSAGNDTLSGGDGQDTIQGGSGDDSILGGAGNDNLSGGDGQDIIEGNSGRDNIEGGTDNDTLSGGDGQDTIRGRDGDDSIAGGAGNDGLIGEEGNDILEGGSGVDNLSGGPGDDTLVGGENGDIFHGGDGNDVFVIQLEDHDPTDPFTNGNDFVFDFTSGEDKLDLSNTNVQFSDLIIQQRGTSDDTDVAVDDMTSSPEIAVVLLDTAPANVTENDFIFANVAPTGSNNTIAIAEDGSHTFSTTDFGYSDANGDPFTSVQISSLSLSSGDTLTLNGSDVSSGQTILTSDIANLAYTPAADANGNARSSFSFLVNDGEDFADTSATITFNVTATNDTASFGGDLTGAIVEGTDTTNGAATVSDPDTGENGFTDATGLAGTYGTLDIISSGAWTYTLDNSNASINSLPAGEALNDTISVTSIDGSTQDISVTITGVNDTPSFGGDLTALIAEGTDTFSGTATISDADSGESSFTAASDIAGTYGTLDITSGGAWTYTLDNSNPTIDNLNNGQSLTDTVSITSLDGTSQDITVTITGVNDVPIAPTPLPEPVSAPVTVPEHNPEPHQPTSLLDQTQAARDGVSDIVPAPDADIARTISGDLIELSDNDDQVFAGADDDIIFGFSGDDTLGGCSDNDHIYGGTGDDVIYGLSGTDALFGGAGNDVIFNGEGDDTAMGGAGDDILWAGYGNDTLSGGEGADTFKFGTYSGTDTIADFDPDNDVLDLTHTVADFSHANSLIKAANVFNEDGVSGILIDLGGDNCVFLADLTLADLNDISFTFG